VGVREYDFIVGPETSTQPTVSTPSVDEDLISLGYTKQTGGTRGSPINITAGGGITPTGALIEVMFIQGDGGPINITANPQIAAPTVTTQILILIGRHDTNTVTFEHSDGLVLNGNITLYADDMLYLIYDGTNWVEMGRNK
jgi:hypothetical protein